MVSSTGATLEGQVNPNNEKTSGYLQYSTSDTVNGSGPAKGALETATPTETPPGAEIGANFEDHLVGPAAVTGLTAGTTYYYQAVATNTTGTTYGPVQELTTVPAPQADNVEAITATTATLNGHFTLNPNVATQYHFVYRLGSACTGEGQIETPTEEAGEGTTTEKEAVPVTELQPNATYSACFVTSDAYGSEVDPTASQFKRSPRRRKSTARAPPLHPGSCWKPRSTQITRKRRTPSNTRPRELLLGER